jgi:hypothetical protein
MSETSWLPSQGVSTEWQPNQDEVEYLAEGSRPVQGNL